MSLRRTGRVEAGACSLDFDAEGRVSHHFLRNALQFAVLMASVFFLIVAGRDGRAKSEWVRGE
jgi:hypothetical protein